MNDSTRVMRRPRRARPTTARTAAAAIAAAVLGLSSAACSGGSPSSASSASASTTGSARSPSAIAYSACVRSHGVTNFPDPDSSGQVPKGDAQHFGVSTSQLQAAQSACQALYPDSDGSLDQQAQECMSTGNCPQALVQQILTVEQKFAACMRSHGVPDWPDPSIDAEGRPIFAMSDVPGRNRSYWRTPQITAKVDACQRQAPSPVPFG